MASNLLLTRNKENGIIGGGYTLNSLFLNSGIPAFTHTRGGQSGGRSRSKDPDLDTIKVSDVIEYANGNDKVIVPAGIFMVHGKIEIDDNDPSSSSSKSKSLADTFNKMYDSNSNSNSESDTSDTDEPQSEVISNDMYQNLLAMVSPDNVHKYWNPTASNTRRRKKQTASNPSINHDKNKSRKKRQ
jgi:hypothetical protein